jgi:hypothetical protein
MMCVVAAGAEDGMESVCDPLQNTAPTHMAFRASVAPLLTAYEAASQAVRLVASSAVASSLRLVVTHHTDCVSLFRSFV